MKYCCGMLKCCRGALKFCRSTLKDCRRGLKYCRGILKRCRGNLNFCRDTLKLWREGLNPAPDYRTHSPSPRRNALELKDRGPLRWSIGRSKGRGNVPNVPALHQPAVPQVNNAHDRHGYLGARRGQITQGTGIPQAGGQADSHPVLRPEDILDDEVSFTKRRKQLPGGNLELARTLR